MGSETVNESTLNNQDKPFTSSHIEIYKRSKKSVISDDQSQFTNASSSCTNRQTSQTESLDDYFLSRDIKRRTIRPPPRFAKANCISIHSMEANVEELTTLKRP